MGLSVAGVMRPWFGGREVSIRERYMHYFVVKRTVLPLLLKPFTYILSIHSDP
jgi:hypothetical protein